MGKEGSYGSIWQKVRSMLAYMYDNFVEDYDFFHVCGDDTYLLVENLRQYLARDEKVLSAEGQCSPLYIGGWMQPYWLLSGKEKKWIKDIGGLPWKDFYYNGGGAGYTLNRVALAKLVNDIFPRYLDDVDLSPEDLFIGMSFWKYGIFPFDSRDEFGRERYHQWSPLGLIQPEMLLKKERNWQAFIHNYSTAKIGVDSVSSTSVAFHKLASSVDIRRFYLDLNIDEKLKVCNKVSSGSNQTQTLEII